MRYVLTAFYCSTLLTAFFWSPLWTDTCFTFVVSWKPYTYSAHQGIAHTIGTPLVLCSASEWPAICIDVGWFGWAQKHQTRFVTCSWSFSLPPASLLLILWKMLTMIILRLFKFLEILLMYGMYISWNCWSINGLTQNFTCQLRSACVMKSYAHLHLPFWFAKIECPVDL